MRKLDKELINNIHMMRTADIIKGHQKILHTLFFSKNVETRTE